MDLSSDSDALMVVLVGSVLFRPSWQTCYSSSFERRSKEYSRQKMRQHRLWQADLSTKLKLKLAALEALPPHLRAAAEKPDLSLFPLNRNIWRDTPPVEAGKGAVTSAAAHAARTRNIGTKRQ